MKGYAEWFPRALKATALVVTVTGLLLVPTMFEMRLEMDVPWRLDIEDRLVAVASHVLFSFALLLALGAILQSHVPAGIRKAKNTRSGIASIACLAILGFTGVGILYAGDPMSSVVSSVSHTLFGIVLAATFIVHVIAAKMSDSRSRDETLHRRQRHGLPISVAPAQNQADRNSL